MYTMIQDKAIHRCLSYSHSTDRNINKPDSGWAKCIEEGVLIDIFLTILHYISEKTFIQVRDDNTENKTTNSHGKASHCLN